ncbi:uncharacterized protein LOC132718174 [Ruditapes philippinarum]|uniref:uncharacterized protein LOC132718174 n=1 Tax=Ruditapes philippinarum TaxID=129788 RepID=UPI00295BB09A|nr:uncharacterized protein LOC132718174 [Ruditapes philippinarum]
MGVVKDFREAFKGVCPCLHARNSFEWCSRVGLGVIFLLVLPSQTVGMFTSHWVYSDNCSDVNLLYKDCGNATISGPNALGSSAFGLQVASYIVLLGTILVYICILCCFYRNDEIEKENPIGKFCFPCFIPIGCLVSGE